jgi:glycosyltransferase involved in cell wall biosynthesis
VQQPARGRPFVRTVSTLPSLSIGLPVYNGERYLREAIDATLGQRYEDFELIISDNASTDQTGPICLEYAARDKRIRYFRNEANVGPAPNFNLTLQMARAPLFRWAAHDDVVAPDYLDSCVSLLQATPDAVLCQSHVKIIDPNGLELGTYDGGLGPTESADVVERFAALTGSRHLATHLFGVVRTDALRRVGGLGDYYGADRATLVSLGLLGRFVHVPRLLFMNREHPGRTSRASGYAVARTETSSNTKPRSRLRTLEMYRDYRHAVGELVPDPADRRKCFALLSRWWWVDWNFARLAVDVVGVRVPAVYDLVTRLKVYFYGPIPQIGLRRLPDQPQALGVSADHVDDRST